MVKKAFIISACLITVIVIVSIVISLTYLKSKKPLEFKTVVSYETENNVIKAAPSNNTNKDSNDMSLLSNLLNYEKTVTFSTIVLAIIFSILFYGTRRSRG